MRGTAVTMGHFDGTRVGLPKANQFKNHLPVFAKTSGNAEDQMNTWRALYGVDSDNNPWPRTAIDMQLTTANYFKYLVSIMQKNSSPALERLREISASDKSVWLHVDGDYFKATNIAILDVNAMWVLHPVMLDLLQDLSANIPAGKDWKPAKIPASVFQDLISKMGYESVSQTKVTDTENGRLFADCDIPDVVTSGEALPFWQYNSMPIHERFQQDLGLEYAYYYLCMGQHIKGVAQDALTRILASSLSEKSLQLDADFKEVWEAGVIKKGSRSVPLNLTIAFNYLVAREVPPFQISELSLLAFELSTHGEAKELKERANDQRYELWERKRNLDTDPRLKIDNQDLSPDKEPALMKKLFSHFSTHKPEYVNLIAKAYKAKDLTVIPGGECRSFLIREGLIVRKAGGIRFHRAIVNYLREGEKAAQSKARRSVK